MISYEKFQLSNVKNINIYHGGDTQNPNVRLPDTFTVEIEGAFYPAKDPLDPYDIFRNGAVQPAQFTVRVVAVDGMTPEQIKAEALVQLQRLITLPVG